MLFLSGCGSDNHLNLYITSESSTSESVTSESAISGTAITDSEITDSPGAGETASHPDSAAAMAKPKILVAYFSCTGRTKTLAEYAARELGADLYEIVPEEPYTSADLNYNDDSSRASLEMKDDSMRPAIDAAVAEIEMGEYDIIILGYPIWWGQAPRILSTFIESYDFSDKTIIPFCTSGSSGIGSSASRLQALCSGERTVWLAGSRLNSTAEDDMAAWIDELALNKGEKTMQITVSANGNTIVYQLNDSQAAKEFHAQLPLTLEVEDYGSIEKIFYPPVKLSTDHTPAADAHAGTLAYYAPWGDVVMFYGSFGFGSGLYELGEIVSGSEYIREMTGTITVSGNGNE